jgi:Uma2 family endonuclease
LGFADKSGIIDAARRAGLEERMGTATKLSFKEFQRLQESADDSVRYELDEGEPVLTPSPTPRHNLVSFKLRRALGVFVKMHDLGVVTTEVDFRLAGNVVRKPDVAFIAKDRMEGFDLDRTPVEGAPSLAVEVISAGNLAQDTLKKVRQYLAAGSDAVWLVYPALGVLEIHDRSGVREVTAPASLSDESIFPGLKFTLSLTEMFDEGE